MVITCYSVIAYDVNLQTDSELWQIYLYLKNVWIVYIVSCYIIYNVHADVYWCWLHVYICASWKLLTHMVTYQQSRTCSTILICRRMGDLRKTQWRALSAHNSGNCDSKRFWADKPMLQKITERERERERERESSN